MWRPSNKIILQLPVILNINFVLANSFKVNLFLSAWKKYIPVIRILLKKSAEEIQVLNMNRTDFERDAKRKLGYSFAVRFSNARPDIIASRSEITQSFTQSLLNDDVISKMLLKHDYTFTLNNKYQLEIKNNCTDTENIQPN